MGFPGGSEVKNLPAIQGTWVDPWVGKMPWRIKCRPVPVFLPGKSHGQRSLAGLQYLGSPRVGHDLETQPSPPPLNKDQGRGKNKTKTLCLQEGQKNVLDSQCKEGLTL